MRREYARNEFADTFLQLGAYAAAAPGNRFNSACTVTHCGGAPFLAS
jgi:hypothetical protein